MSEEKTKKMQVELPLTKNSHGSEVLKIQQWLNDLNDYYLFNKKERIKENSYFDDPTIRMIKAFQKFVDLPKSGLYESKTHDLVKGKFFNMLENLKKMLELKRQEQVMGASRKCQVVKDKRAQ